MIILETRSKQEAVARTEELTEKYTKEVKKLEALNRLELQNYEEFMADKEDHLVRLQDENHHLKKEV